MKYVLDKRIINLKEDGQLIKKINLIEFYWFNWSPNRREQSKESHDIELVPLCNCMNCKFLKKFLDNKIHIILCKSSIFFVNYISILLTK